jgi:histidinol dehydrogenase
MKIIDSNEFDEYWKKLPRHEDKQAVDALVKEIIAAVHDEGDEAVKRYAAKFDKASPRALEVPPELVMEALAGLKKEDAALAEALAYSAQNIKCFAMLQKEQFKDFENSPSPGLFTGQRVIPVERAAVYVPGGRFPLISSALMGLIPAFVSGVEELVLASPPGGGGNAEPTPGFLRILAAAALAAETCGRELPRVFQAGGAQAIAALAFGTESIPRCDVIVGPGNKYVAAAKRIIFGEAGIDFVAGPTDVLIISDGSGCGRPALPAAARLIAADMLAQAEHDADARARALVPDRQMADAVVSALETRLGAQGGGSPAARSLEAGGLIILYKDMAEAVRIANAIAPEHLELQVEEGRRWISSLKNYGSLFVGAAAAEVLGDYSAGINHTLPTSGSARFTGGLSVRHFLKTVTSLRCEKGAGLRRALDAARVIARAEGLGFHAQSAEAREGPG